MLKKLFFFREKHLFKCIGRYGFLPCLTVSYTYDGMDRVSEVRYGDTLMYAYHYDGEGNLQRITDHSLKEHRGRNTGEGTQETVLCVDLLRRT